MLYRILKHNENIKLFSIILRYKLWMENNVDTFEQLI